MQAGQYVASSSTIVPPWLKSGGHMDLSLPERELLLYYQKRAENFDNDREDLLRLLQECTPSLAELRKLEHECDTRTAEVCTLQKALSDAHNFLFDERARILALQDENNRLRLQEQEDRRRIQSLLALTQPVTEEITYLRDRVPEAVSILPPAQQRTGNRSVIHGESLQFRGQAQERVLKTVYLPTEKTDTLIQQVDLLNEQLKELKEYSDERINALLEDRRIRETNYAAKVSADESRVKDLREALASKDHLLRKTTRDLLLLRQELSKTERAAQRHKTKAALAETSCKELELEQQACLELLPNELLPTLERLRAIIRAKVALEGDMENPPNSAADPEKAKDMSSRLQTLTDSLSASSQELKAVVTRSTDSDIAAFRGQVREREAEIVRLEGVNAAVKAQYQERIEYLETRLSKLRQQYQELEYRRALDVEGFASEVAILRKLFTKLERKTSQVMQSVKGEALRKSQEDLASEVQRTKERMRKMLAKFAFG